MKKGRKISKTSNQNTKIKDNVEPTEERCTFDSSLKVRLLNAQAHFEKHDIEKGTEALLNIENWIARSRETSDDDKERYRKLLFFAQKAKECEMEMVKCAKEKDRKGQYLLNDKLADLYYDAGFKKAALHHYKATIGLAESDHQKINAFVSCAKTAGDLKDYGEAARYFEKVRSIEDEKEMDTSETRASLFAMLLLGGEFDSDSDVNTAVDELENDLKQKHFLTGVYNAAAEYYEKKGDKDEARRFRSLEDKCRERYPPIVDLTETEEENVQNADKMGNMRDVEILNVMKDRAKETAKEAEECIDQVDEDKENQGNFMNNSMNSMDLYYENNEDVKDARPFFPSTNVRRRLFSPLLRRELTSDTEEKMLSGQKKIKKAKKRSAKIEVENGDDFEIEKIPEEKKAKKRSVKIEDENGIGDDFKIEEISEPKRRRSAFESSQSEVQSIVSTIRNIDQPISLDDVNELAHDGAQSDSLLAATAVITETPGVESDRTVPGATSQKTMSDVPKSIESGGNVVSGASCLWEFKQRYSGSDSFQSLISSALQTFDNARPASLVLSDGSKYSEKTRDALWRAIEAHSLNKTREDGEWRADVIKLDHFGKRYDVPSFALRALIRMRPRDILSLRDCNIDDAKLEEIIEGFDNIPAVVCCDVLDLSFNESIITGDNVGKMIRKLGVKTLILQGLSDVEEGCGLMTHLRGIPLNSLILDENPWLDDSSMQELVKDNGISSLTTLKISKCAVKTMVWLEVLKSLKNLTLAENNCIVGSGWDRVAEFIRSTGPALQNLDISGTAVKSEILDALAARSSDAPLLSVTMVKCNRITAVEICRAFGPLMLDRRSPINVKLLLEKEKIEEVRATAPLIAAKVLKVSPN